MKPAAREVAKVSEPKREAPAAEAKLATATEALKSCRDAAASIEAEQNTAKADVTGLDALPELAPQDMLRAENLRRRIRTLGEQLAVAQAAVAEAEKARTEAEIDVRIAERQDAFTELAALSDAFVSAVKSAEVALRTPLESFRRKRQEVDTLDAQLEPHVEFRRRSWHLLAHFTGSQDEQGPHQSPLIAGHELLKHEHWLRHQAEIAARREAEEEADLARPRKPAYSPPRDETGSWIDRDRPEPGGGLDANGATIRTIIRQ